MTDTTQTDHSPLVVSWGAGWDSTALIIECHRRGIKVEAILFADVGAEKPGTYEHVWAFQAWLMEHAPEMPPVTVVRNDAPRSTYDSIEGACFQNQTLPSLAFGMKSCSLRWKAQPQHKWLRHWDVARRAWAEGKKVRRAIGYDDSSADRKRSGKVTIAIGLDDSPADQRRAAKARKGRSCGTYAGAGLEADRYEYWYPLQEWHITREECGRIIEEAGLPIPPKSACYFCPAAHREEVLELRETAPEQYHKALTLEHVARLGKHGFKSTVGLGRSWSWNALVTEAGYGAEAEAAEAEARQLLGLTQAQAA